MASRLTGLRTIRNRGFGSGGLTVRGFTVRGRTLAGGAVLGGLLLLVLALLGGVGEDPDRVGEPAPERLGPVTAIQPQLQEALLDDQDLPATPPPSPTPAAPAAVPAVATPEPAGPDPVPAGPGVTGPIAGLCRALFEDPAGLSGLWRSGPWPATAPQETSARQTARDGGATLHQVLGVFEADRSVEAYHQLRELAAGCDRFRSTLPDGTPVTVLLRELSWDRQESDRRESGYADNGYAMTITVVGEERSLTGWLSLDRLGPVVSVLRQLGPADRSGESGSGSWDSGDWAESLAETRLTALTKLRPLLAELRE